jgi:hypothetical protein
MVRVWRYQVAPAMRAEFEREYAPDGSWARLFALSPGFVETRLYADVNAPGAYLTVDRFAVQQAWQHVQAEHAEEYRSLATRLGHLTAEQEELV